MSASTSEQRLSILKSSVLRPDDATARKLTTVWDQVRHFVVEDLADGFQFRDIYSLIVAVWNGLQLYLGAESGQTLKGYAIFLVSEIVRDLISSGVIPPQVSVLLPIIPTCGD